jgi:hypothetical protein
MDKFRPQKKRVGSVATDVGLCAEEEGICTETVYLTSYEVWLVVLIIAWN